LEGRPSSARQKKDDTKIVPPFNFSRSDHPRKKQGGLYEPAPLLSAEKRF
jgi:hypothetical protein